MYRAEAHRSLPDLTGRAAILCFHAIIDHPRDPWVEPDALHLNDFRAMLKVLRRSFNVISLDEMVSTLRANENLPARTVVLTFDDGYANNAELAAPVLDEMGIPWSAFLPPAFIEDRQRQWTDDLRMLVHRGSAKSLHLQWQGGLHDFDLNTPEQRTHVFETVQDWWRYADEDKRRPGIKQVYAHYSRDELNSLRERYATFAPMTWDQARELKASGVGIGNHSLHHLPLGEQPEEVVRHEITAGRDLLTRRIGEHLNHFSYPYGRQTSVNTLTDRVLSELGYQSGLTLEQNVVTSESDLLRLPRLIVAPQLGRNLFTLWQRFIR